MASGTPSVIRWTTAPGLRVCTAPAYGRQHLGLAPGGPQDRWSAGWVNHLCGNDPSVAVLEGTLVGATLHVDAPTAICLGGSVDEAAIDGRPISPWTLRHVAAGSEVRVVAPCSGLRWYLAACAARPHADGLDHGPPRGEDGDERRAVPELTAWMPRRGHLRILPGPEWERLTDPARLTGPWRIGTQSSGMGLRLDGAAFADLDCDIPSAGIADGTIQATPAGPILLLRQRAALGGYARLAQVLDHDVDLAAQCRPGQVLHLDLVDEEEAHALADLRRRAQWPLSSTS